jgi:fatty acid desaturase
MSTKTMIIGPKTTEEMAAFEKDIDAIRAEAQARVGKEDANYIRSILRLVRVTETAGRALLMAGWFPPAWILGACLLGISKIIDNMELGHNVMHGQFSWMNDPRFQGDTFEWDNTCPREEWRHSHNYIHHDFTNIIGKDRDFGYGLLRLTSELRWSPMHLFQLPLTLVLAGFFEWFVAVHDLQLDKIVIGRKTWASVAPQWKLVRAKMWRQISKDYIMWPLAGAAVGALFGHMQDAALAVLLGNLLANFIRNVWAAAIIFCGHFADDIYTFDRSCLDGETRGQWYLRQVLGSSNITGSGLMHLMSGNLSHQVEHHLFPDLPASRYIEVAPKVRAVCARYGIPYNTGYFIPRVLTVLKRIARYSLPGGAHTSVRIEVDSILPEKA